jgi:hypothetical protein
MDEQRRQDLESDLTQLHRILAERFSEEELRTLCFNLNVDYDDLPAKGKANKARELIAYLERRDRIPELLETGQRSRPDISWSDAPEPPSEGPPARISQIEFVNREHELDMLNVERLRASQSPYVLINAPAGYGKSYLLQSLVNTIRSDETLDREWSCRYLDFSQQTGIKHVNYVVQSIAGQPAQNDADAAIDTVRDHVVRELTAPSAEGRRALLLIFDSVERLDEQTGQWLYKLLCELHRRTRLGHKEIITVRVIIAGRDVESFWEGYERACPKPPAPQRISLSPFDEHPIQTLIWNQAEAIQIPLDDQTVIQLADEVHYLSGGHPSVIRSLVNDLARQSFAVGPLPDYFEENRERMVREYLSPVADELAESVKEKLSKAAQILSVFRRVNANTVQAFTNLLPLEKSEIDLLGDMQRAHLLNGPGIREPFYRDPLMRRIWALNMAHGCQESRAQYRRLNKMALELYASWIHNLGRGLPDTPLKATQRLLSVVEWLFHALQDEDMDEDELCSRLQEHIRVLSAGDRPLSVADLIADEIKQDSEVRYLLRHRLGDDGISTVCDWLQAL